MKSSLYFILLSFLPIAYKLLFWLYLVQLKEYRCDRIKDYLRTPQWKKAIFNFFFFMELSVFLLMYGYYFGYINYTLVYYSLVFLLQAESLYVFWKIFSNKLFIPKFTKRLIILAFTNIITIIAGWLIIVLYPNLILLIISFLLFFLPVIVLFWNALTSIFFDKVKEKIFKKASQKIKELNIYTIAITGSYGKSSTKEFLAKLLENKFNVIKTPKNINTEIWISSFILNELENKIKKSNKPPIFIAEAGAYSKWEIKKIWEILNHKDWFLTWLGNQHLGLFWNEQNLVEGKFEIWEKVYENNGKLFINTSNIKILTDKIVITDKANIVNYSVNKPNILKKLGKEQIITYPEEVKILNITKEKNVYWTHFIWDNKRFFTNIIWIWQIENLIWAIKFALKKWISLDEISKTIKNLDLPNHTMQINEHIIKLPTREIKTIIIDDSYNLSVNWLINAIETIQFLDWDKILILDDILELGKQAHKIHYKIGQYLASKIDKILFVGVNYKKDLIKWLKESNFKWEILDKMPNIIKDSILILEWRRAQKYNKLN